MISATSKHLISSFCRKIDFHAIMLNSGSFFAVFEIIFFGIGKKSSFTSSKVVNPITKFIEFTSKCRESSQLSLTRVLFGSIISQPLHINVPACGKEIVKFIPG